MSTSMSAKMSMKEYNNNNTQLRLYLAVQWQRRIQIRDMTRREYYNKYCMNTMDPISFPAFEFLLRYPNVIKRPHNNQL